MNIISGTNDKNGKRIIEERDISFMRYQQEGKYEERDELDKRIFNKEWSSSCCLSANTKMSVMIKRKCCLKKRKVLR